MVRVEGEHRWQDHLIGLPLESALFSASSFTAANLNLICFFFNLLVLLLDKKRKGSRKEAKEDSKSGNTEYKETLGNCFSQSEIKIVVLRVAVNYIFYSETLTDNIIQLSTRKQALMNDLQIEKAW